MPPGLLLKPQGHRIVTACRLLSSARVDTQARAFDILLNLAACSSAPSKKVQAPSTWHMKSSFADVAHQVQVLGAATLAGPSLREFLPSPNVRLSHRTRAEMHRHTALQEQSQSFVSTWHP